jgi:hypothetical protein
LVTRVVEELLSQRSVIESVELGLMTRDEAALLVMAHLHSEVLQLAADQSGEPPWDNEPVLTMCKSGLFGQPPGLLDERQS